MVYSEAMSEGRCDTDASGVIPNGPETAVSLPSLREILALPAFAGAELLTGRSRLDDPVTWVHVSELLDAWRFLSGGELLVSTGLELARVMPEAREPTCARLWRRGRRGWCLSWSSGSAKCPTTCSSRRG